MRGHRWVHAPARQDVPVVVPTEGRGPFVPRFASVRGRPADLIQGVVIHISEGAIIVENREGTLRALWPHNLRRGRRTRAECCLEGGGRLSSVRIGAECVFTKGDSSDWALLKDFAKVSPVMTFWRGRRPVGFRQGKLVYA